MLRHKPGGVQWSPRDERPPDECRRGGPWHRRRPDGGQWFPRDGHPLTGRGPDDQTVDHSADADGFRQQAAGVAPLWPKPEFAH